VAWSRVPEVGKRRLLKEFTMTTMVDGKKLARPCLLPKNVVPSFIKSYCPFGALLQKINGWPSPWQTHQELVTLDWDGGPVTLQAVNRFMVAWDSGRITTRGAFARAIGVKLSED